MSHSAILGHCAGVRLNTGVYHRGITQGYNTGVYHRGGYCNDGGL